MEVVASLSQGRTAAAQCGLFTHKSVPIIFEPPCIFVTTLQRNRSVQVCYGSNGITKCYIVLDLGLSSNQILSILNKDFDGFP